jgi:hypothetical protein
MDLSSHSPGRISCDVIKKTSGAAKLQTYNLKLSPLVSANRIINNAGEFTL